MGNYLQCNRKILPNRKPKPIPTQANYPLGNLGQKVMCNRNYNQKASWKLVNEVYGRKKARTVKSKGKNVKERLGSWYDHFSNLHSGDLSADSIDDKVKQIFQKLPIDDSPFTMDENKAVMKNIKTGKAAGPDGISLEVLKIL